MRLIVDIVFQFILAGRREEIKPCQMMRSRRGLGVIPGGLPRLATGRSSICLMSAVKSTGRRWRWRFLFRMR